MDDENTKGNDMIKQFKLLLLMLIALPLIAIADETAETLSAVDLKKEPYSDASMVTALPALAALSVVKRQGAWVNVKSTAGSGWLKMTTIKLTDGSSNAKKSGDYGLSSLFNLGRKSRTASNGVTVTTGIRGLSEEELKNAQPNPQAVDKMDGFASNKSAGEKFAAKAKLKSQQIDYLKP